MNHLQGRGCRTDRELALLRTTSDLTLSQIKRLPEPTVKLGLETLGAYDTLQRAAHASIDCIGNGENGLPRSLRERVGSA
jgi:hypothetical protein